MKPKPNTWTCMKNTTQVGGKKQLANFISGQILIKKIFIPKGEIEHRRYLDGKSTDRVVVDGTAVKGKISVRSQSSNKHEEASV